MILKIFLVSLLICQLSEQYIESFIAADFYKRIEIIAAIKVEDSEVMIQFLMEISSIKNTLFPKAFLSKEEFYSSSSSPLEASLFLDECLNILNEPSESIKEFIESRKKNSTAPISREFWSVPKGEDKVAVLKLFIEFYELKNS